ncbi:MAG: carbon starvation CstA family protein, partial [Roseibacillus sp.]
FITIACGAISGFHCLVSSGTSSKQVRCETDAQFVGYGSMLTEGFLATLVILACVAGLGLGTKGVDGAILLGSDAYDARYGSWAAAGGLGAKVGAFVEGSANFLTALGLSAPFAIALMGVFVASFAATTLDTACRLQRYVVQELASTFVPREAVGSTQLRFNPLRWLTNKHGATIFAIVVAGALAYMPGKPGGAPGTGGLLLWPLFGATNQLLAGLAFLVIAFWLWRRSIPVWFIVIPTIFMLILPGIAMSMNVRGFIQKEQWLLAGLGIGTIALQLWIIFEAVVAWPRAKGVLESYTPGTESLPDGGRSC